MSISQIAFLRPAVSKPTLVKPAIIPTVTLRQSAPAIQAVGFSSPALANEKRQILPALKEFSVQSYHEAKYANNDELLSDGSST